MRKTIFAIIVLATLTACGGKTAQGAGADSTEVAADSAAEQTFAPDEAGKEFIQKFYAAITGIDYDEAAQVVRRSVTPKGRQQLTELYDYDCESGDCIPVWMFFDGGGADVDQTRLKTVEQIAPDTYRCTLETTPVGDECFFFRYRINIRLAKTADGYKIDGISDWEGEDVKTAEGIAADEAPTLPETAKSVDVTSQYELYINVDKASANEGETPAVYSVWLVDNQTKAARRLLETNPNAEAQWQRMTGDDPDAVSVPIDQIACAERGWILTEDAEKIVVEGCPDGRNEWTYLIDIPTMTAKQLPGGSGFQGFDSKRRRLVVQAYGYHPEGGRYEFRRAFDYDGKFIERTEEIEM